MQKQWIIVWSAALTIVAAILLAPSLFINYQLKTGNWVLVEHNVPFMDAHQLAVNTFVQSEGFGFGRFRDRGLWNAVTLNFEGKEYFYDSIHLIGLTPEHGHRYFDPSFPPRKETLSSFYARRLEPDQAKAAAELIAKAKPYAVIPSSEGLKVIAPLFRQEECRKCHPGAVGEVLGAFEYTLSPNPSNVVSAPP